MHRGEACGNDFSVGYDRRMQSLLEKTTLGRVVDFHDHYPVIAGSCLVPSQAGCVGDTGTVSETRVVDVIEEGGGLLHVTDGRLSAKPGDVVFVSRDPERRARVERTHTGVALAQTALNRAGLEVGAVEIAAGMGWIEVCGVAPSIDLAEMAERDDPIDVRPLPGGRMQVRIGEDEVSTYFAPISHSTGELGAAQVRVISESVAGEVLEVSLPDREGRQWWL
jgi:Ser-tRNA(Ala) deacylase AlaX